MRISLFALLLIVSVARAGGTAQTHPDFSGRWVLIGASGHSVDLAQTVAVQTTTVDTDASGRPMALYGSALLVSREVDGVAQTEALKVGLQGGVVGGVSEGSGPASREARSLWSVRWVDDCLVNYVESSLAAAEAGPAVTRSRTEQWCMNTARHLVVTVRIAQSGMPPLNATRVYRNNSHAV